MVHELTLTMDFVGRTYKGYSAQYVQQNTSPDDPMLIEGCSGQTVFDPCFDGILFNQVIPIGIGQQIMTAGAPASLSLGGFHLPHVVPGGDFSYDPLEPNDDLPGFFHENAATWVKENADDVYYIENHPLTPHSIPYAIIMKEGTGKLYMKVQSFCPLTITFEDQGPYEFFDWTGFAFRTATVGSGNDLTIEFWAKAGVLGHILSGSGNLTLSVDWYMSGGEFLATSDAVVNLSSTTYTNHVVTFTAPINGVWAVAYWTKSPTDDSFIPIIDTLTVLVTS